MIIRDRLFPASVALVAAVLWGLWWIPIRYLNDIGLPGSVAGFAINLGALPFILLLVLFGRRGWGLPMRGAIGAVLAGLAITTYATALAYTDVVRVVLLFYLAPAWSTLIECVFMGRRWSWQSVIAISMSLFGMMLILGGGLSPHEVGAGEIMAIMSGLAWSVGAALLFSTGKFETGPAALVAIVVAVVASAVAMLVEFGFDFPVSVVEVSELTAPVVLLSGGLYFAPMIVLTLWSARLLPPALLSFLLSAEIISGVGSSAALLDEHFGLVELAGTICIAGAAVIEFLLPGRNRKQEAQ